MAVCVVILANFHSIHISIDLYAEHKCHPSATDGHVRHASSTLTAKAAAAGGVSVVVAAWCGIT